MSAGSFATGTALADHTAIGIRLRLRHLYTHHSCRWFISSTTSPLPFFASVKVPATVPLPAAVTFYVMREESPSSLVSSRCSLFPLLKMRAVIEQLFFGCIPARCVPAHPKHYPQHLQRQKPSRKKYCSRQILCDSGGDGHSI